MPIGNSSRYTPGNVSTSGGGGGGTSSQILTGQALIAGVTEITHTLGAVPLSALFFRSNGQTLVLSWVPKPGSTTTIIQVTSVSAQSNVTIQLSTNS